VSITDLNVHVIFYGLCVVLVTPAFCKVLCMLNDTMQAKRRDILTFPTLSAIVSITELGIHVISNGLCVVV
jgi:hypothetical protein